MLSRVYKKFEAVCERKVSGTGLAVFRVLFGLILFAEVFQLYYFKNLIFDPVPFFMPAEFNTGIFLLVWLMVIICIISGLFTFHVAILNYLFILFAIAFPSYFSYHFDYFLTTVAFLLIFIPVSSNYSLDNYLKGRTQKKQISLINIYILILFGVVFAYSDSFLHKIENDNWLNGLGFWFPACMPFATYLNLSFLLDNKFISLFLGYATLVLQCIIPVLIFFRRFWTFIAIAGIIFHLGIALSYPIPLFGIGMACFYILLLPESLWKKFKFPVPGFLKRKYLFTSDHLKNYSLPEPHEKAKMKTYKNRLIFFFLFYACIIQLMCFHASYPINKIYKFAGLFEIGNKINALTSQIRFYNQQCLGITSHGLFPDEHFMNYNHIVSIAYKDVNGREKYLPIINQDGQVHFLNTGRLFCEWTFDIISPQVEMGKLKTGLGKYTSYWLNKSQLPLNTIFIIKIKKIRTPLKWEKGVFEEQIRQPWLEAGTCYWENGTFISNIKNIESI
jgi:Vitamin K-dependent gamma-carboxylase